jgi:CTP:phosphocholine cytidylyltransferase-like protein
MDWLTVIVPLIGTIIGTGGGIIMSARLTTYRIQQLEKKVDKHNMLCERMIMVEKDIQFLKHEMTDNSNCID